MHACVRRKPGTGGPAAAACMRCARRRRRLPPRLPTTPSLNRTPVGQLSAEEHYENAEMAFAMEAFDQARASFKRALDMEPEVGAGPQWVLWPFDGDGLCLGAWAGHRGACAHCCPAPCPCMHARWRWGWRPRRRRRRRLRRRRLLAAHQSRWGDALLTVNNR